MRAAELLVALAQECGDRFVLIAGEPRGDVGQTGPECELVREPVLELDDTGERARGNGAVELDPVLVEVAFVVERLKGEGHIAGPAQWYPRRLCRGCSRTGQFAQPDREENQKPAN